MLKCSKSQLELIKDVCFKLGIDWREIQYSKKDKYSEAKFILYRVFKLLDLSYPQIANIFEKNHTTIIYGEKKCIENPELNQKALEFFCIFKQKRNEIIRNETLSKIAKNIIEREKFKDLYNKGFSLLDISKKLNLDKEKTSNIFNYLNSRCKKKLVPDYKNNSYRYIFL